MDVTMYDFPALRDALNTIAEFDLVNGVIGESPAMSDAFADAARNVRNARESIIDAIDALRRVGVEMGDDDDD